jgi:hypothetical protein
MKTTQRILMILLATALIVSSCTKRKQACAAYDRIEIPQQH